VGEIPAKADPLIQMDARLRERNAAALYGADDAI